MQYNKNKKNNIMPRITLLDSVESVISKMSEGNIGAMNVCMLLMAEGGNIDRQNTMGGLVLFLTLIERAFMGQIYMFFGMIYVIVNYQK